MRNKMWLFTKNINTDKLFKKLDHYMIDPFKMIRKKNILLSIQLDKMHKNRENFHSNIL